MPSATRSIETLEGCMTERLSEGTVVWITGLSGAGKTTLARTLGPMLKAHGSQVLLLDGDELRAIFGEAHVSAHSYGRQARLEVAMRYARLCQMLSRQGALVVIATISLFEEVHEWNRAHLSRYFEVYVKTPVDELRRRDPKGIYKRFDSGEISCVAGLDLPVDEPASPDSIVDFVPGQSVTEVARALLHRLTERKLI